MGLGASGFVKIPKTVVIFEGSSLKAKMVWLRMETYITKNNLGLSMYDLQGDEGMHESAFVQAGNECLVG